MENKNTVTKKIADLAADPEIVELRVVNPTVVSKYRQAMRQGDQFPPILIDQNDRVISGNHRYAAMLEEWGKDAEAVCEQMVFLDEAARIEEAARENAKHGHPLDGFSRRKFALKLVEMGRRAEDVGRLLGVSAKRVEEWGDMCVVIRGKGSKPIKHGLEHLSGQTVKKTEYDEHVKHDRGVPALTQARQLTSWLRNGWINISDGNTVSALEELQHELNKTL